MKIILSPAKKMNVDLETLEPLGLPVFPEQTREILTWLQGKSYEELKNLWNCNDRIAEQNVKRLAEMELEKRLTPAILSYEGIAYQYMAPAVFEEEHLIYVQKHLTAWDMYSGKIYPVEQNIFLSES